MFHLIGQPLATGDLFQMLSTWRRNRNLAPLADPVQHFVNVLAYVQNGARAGRAVDRIFLRVESHRDLIVALIGGTRWKQEFRLQHEQPFFPHGLPRTVDECWKHLGKYESQ